MGHTTQKAIIPKFWPSVFVTLLLKTITNALGKAVAIQAG